MSKYQRTTRECSFNQVRPALQQAFRDYFTTHELGEPDEIVRLCCETVSNKTESGWLTRWLDEKEEPVIYSAILLTEQSLLWARAGENSAAHVIRANLYEIRVKIFTSLLANDSGMEISGLIEGSKSFMRGYIGMGAEPAAQKFCEEVMQAVEKINPKSTRKFPTWMGGR